ncbi:MAG: CHASE2 domain-containing protein [Halioglobus sp.]|nr:CHASE2 domain-containing protein [Halioglobus sp.]
MNTRARLVYGRLLLTLVGACFCAALHWFNWLQPVDRMIYDTFNEAMPAPEAPDITIVAIDEKSLRELGRWPWPRENHVELLRQLDRADVSAVAMDLLFVEPYIDYPEVDQLLAQAMAQLQNVVLPVFIGQAGPGGRLMEMQPIRALAEAAAGLGHVHIEVDSDGVARGVYLREGLGAARWPHFAVALANVLGRPVQPLPGVSDRRVLDNPAPGAIIRSHANLVPFIGPAGTVAQVSYVDVLKGRVAPAELRGKVLFVGATAAGHVDNITTSLGQISGVEVNANIFHALRNDLLASPVPQAPSAGIALVLIGLTIFFVTRLPPGYLLVALLGAAILLPFMSFLVLQFWRLWLSPGPMLLTLVFAYPLWNWLRLASAMDFIEAQTQELARENDQRSFLGSAQQEPVPDRSDPVAAIMFRLERAYRESRNNHELVRETLQQLAAGVILAEQGGAILLANDEATELLGAAAPGSPLVGALRVIELEEGLQWQAVLAGLQVPGDHFHCEGHRPDRQQDILLNAGIIGLGRPLLLLVLTNVTELKQSEKQRAEALNFLSHDLRAPLTSVLALIESARDTPAAVDMTLLRQIESYIQSNLSYAENFIQLARLEQADPPRFDQCAAQSLVDNAVGQLYHIAASRGIRFELDDAEDDIWLRCSRDLVERVLINLLDNAIKHSPDGAVITVAASSEKQCAVFTVSDEGQGIEAASTQRIFEQFHQGTHARSGAGLGLRFVAAVAQTHGGSIEAENIAAGGSRFTLRLPLPTS